MRHMTSRIRSSLALVLLCAFAPPTWVQAGESDATAPPAPATATRYEVCRAMRSGGGRLTGEKSTMYISGIMLRANINDVDYSSAFGAFITRKYGVQGVSPECLSTPSKADAQKVIDVQWMDRPLAFTYVQTGWTYSR